VIGLGGVSNGAEKESPKKQAEQDVQQIEQEWAKAVVTRDPSWFEKTLAKEWEMILPDGEIWDKQKFFEFLKAGTTTYESCELLEVRVRVYGQAAVAIVRGNVKGKNKDGAFDHEERWIDVYARRQGRWQCVAAQLAVVKK
jgi:ketosteroid isomerase-like protein